VEDVDQKVEEDELVVVREVPEENDGQGKRRKGLG
jgi:hypothetical protein